MIRFRSLATLVAAALVCVDLTATQAATIVSVSGSESNSYTIGAATPSPSVELFAAVWSQEQSYSNVTISALLNATQAGYVVDAYLVQGIVPQTIANQVAQSTVTINAGNGNYTFFSDLTLPAGTYSLVLDPLTSPPNTVGWPSTNSPTIVTDTGVSLPLGNTIDATHFSGGQPAYAPDASNFTASPIGSLEFSVVSVGSVAWAAPTSGNWSTTSSWTPANVPTSTVSASFSTGSTIPYAVTLIGASAANNVTVQGDSVTLNLGSNQLALAGSLSVSGSGGQPGSITITGTTGSSAVVPGGVGVGLPTDSVPTSIAQYDRLGILQGATLTGDVTTNSSGQLLGNGTIVGNVVNGGLVTPGTSTTPGQLLVGGGIYFQTASGALNIRISGPSTSGHFDSLDVMGNVTLGGSLNVSLGVAGGSTFTPSPADSYQIIASGGTIAGTFSNIKKFVPVYANNTLEGAFSINYKIQTQLGQAVTLSNFRPNSPLDFFGVGVDWSGVSDPMLNGIQGNKAASSLMTALQSDFPSYNSNASVLVNSSSGLNATVAGSANATTIQMDFGDQFKPHVGCGDTVVFYMASHGNASGIGISSDTEVTAQWIADLLNELPTTVQKILILESCDSGAVASQFQLNTSTPLVPNMAILAATKGATNTQADNNGIGFFTDSLITALNEGDYNLTQIESDITAITETADAGSFGQPFNLEGSGTGIFEGVDPQLSESSDFSGDLLGQAAAVPEPSTIALLSAGAIGLAAIGSRRRTIYRRIGTRMSYRSDC